MLKAVTNLPRRLRAWRFRLQPQAFWQAYSARAHTLGFEKLYLVPSFDCDTDEDIPAAKKIHDWLLARGHRAVFAVPGAQLKAGEKIFRQMANQGAEFINHGAAAHAEWRGGRYWSTTFYSEMSLDEVEADIRLGHKILEQVTGTPAQGFRAPHFGHYQDKHQLQHIYTILQSEGYVYASTTLPSAHKIFSPLHKTEGIVEFPVSGHYYSPLQVFDSWSHLVSPYQPVITDEYSEKIVTSVGKLLDAGVHGILGYYSDPAHVAGNQSFFNALETCLELGVSLITYSDLLKTLALGKS